MIRPRGTQRQAAIPALLAAWSQHSSATELDLKVAPLISRNPSSPCPASLAMLETPPPSREGSAGIHGWAQNLGMTGLRHPNTLTPVIQGVGVRQGQAARSWSGSD